jgi:hypothetical protein
MPDRERKRGERHGPSTQPVDEGLEGAIFDERDRTDRAEELRDLDAAARGDPRIASRSGESQGSGGKVQDSENDTGEESPPETHPS